MVSCPPSLRRVNQAYVIATSTKVDLASVDVQSIDDTFLLSYEKSSKKSSSVTDLIADKVSNTLTETRKNAQVAVDGSFIANIKKSGILGYLFKSENFHNIIVINHIYWNSNKTIVWKEEDLSNLSFY